MRLNYLDVLKAFAIIAVVLYHSGYMPFGYLGVDLFLVINGYLITKSLDKRLLVGALGEGGSLSVKSNGSWFKEYFGFEVSRVVRLLPVLLVAGVVCMLVGYFVMLPDDYENLSQSVIASNFFGNNILAAITTKNYWDVVNEYKPLMHTWYVGVVMQFYLVYPFLFFLAKIDNKRTRGTLLTVISILALLSLLVYFGTANVAHRFYYLPSRFFEFAVGGIIALAWKPQDAPPFHKWFVYVCYVLLLALMVVDYEIIAANLKLVLVVLLSVVMIMSGAVLENNISANWVLAKVGAASYSIFIWHQLLLAFYRYTISSHFTILGYSLYVVIVAILSWLSYMFIEQKTNAWLNNGKRSRVLFYIITAAVFIIVTGFAMYIYNKGGVVRDVPELYISKNDKVDHKEYNDKIYKLDKPFETDKRHWLVVGNSFGRDFANVILESSVSDSIELSYIYIDKYEKPEYAERFATAERVFLSTLGVDDLEISKIKTVCQSNGMPIENLVIVGVKNFGESNGQFYINRNRPGYFDQRVKMEDGYLESNDMLKDLCGESYLDLIGLVIDDEGMMPVFTPDHHFVSQDCRHFSRGGAMWFAQLIDWSKYLK